MHSPIDSTSQPTPAQPRKLAAGAGPNDALAAIGVLAGLLERMERAGRPIEPTAYRAVVARLERMLSDAAGHPLLTRLLANAPAAAELYENIQYAHAGLCLRPLERSLATEQLARQTIERARRA